MRNTDWRRFGHRRLGTRRWAPLALALAGLTGVSCSPLLPLRFTPSSEARSSVGDLHRVRARGVLAVYVRPGARFWAYDSVLIDPVTVSYRGQPRRPTFLNRSRGNFALDADSMARMKRWFVRSFAQELGSAQGLAVVSEPGPGVLRVSGHIVDLVWNAPRAEASETLKVSDTGRIGLILEILDAATGEVLVLIADRRPLRPAGSSIGFSSTAASQWSAVRERFEHWSWLVRRSIQDLAVLHSVPRPRA